MAISLVMRWLCLVKRYQFLNIWLKLTQKEAVDPHIHKYLVFFCFERRKPTAVKPFSTKYDVGKAMKYIFAVSTILNSN